MTNAGTSTSTPFTQRLRQAQRASDSALCVGLDIDPSRMPVGIAPRRQGLVRFLRGIIESTADLVCAYKPNLAFFEALGAEGWSILHEVLLSIPDGLITIADGKRGDIGSTAERYAAAVFQELNFDAITVNPYQGADSIEPYLADQTRGAFILCKTSNPGSMDFQELLCRFADTEAPLFEIVARKAVALDVLGNVGLVVGATYPEQLARVRALAPHQPILIPGVGTQGGDAAESIRKGAASDGTLAIVNVSRQVLYASSDSNWETIARSEARGLRDLMRNDQAECFEGKSAG